MNSRQLRKLLTEQYSKLTKEEKKKGFGLGSLMKGFGSKGPSTFPPTEVSAREGDEV